MSFSIISKAETETESAFSIFWFMARIKGRKKPLRQRWQKGRPLAADILREGMGKGGSDEREKVWEGEEISFIG